MAASCALYSGPKLAVEKVKEDGALTLQIALPILRSNICVASAISVFVLDVWLVCYLVQVLMKSVDKG